VAGDACAGEIVQPLASHLYDRDDPDIGLPTGELIRTLGRQRKAEIEDLPKSRVVHQPPYQRDRI